MLLNRVLTALVLQGFLLLTLFAFDHLWWFALVVAVVFSVSIWEWGALVGIGGRPVRVLYTLVLVLFCAALGLSIEVMGVTWWFLLPAVLSWPWYLNWLRYYPSPCGWHDLTVRTFHSALISASAVYGLCVLIFMGVPRGSWLVFAMAMAVASMDVGSYFAGQWWGKTSLLPRVSPNKTIGGLIGGVVTSMLISSLFAWGWWYYTGEAMGAVLLMCVLVIAIPFSVGGDLLVSMSKRRAGLKDSGSFLPGHGGFLDRLDGMIGAVPPVVLLFLAAQLAVVP